jgi:ESCRT-II complex subunit VPS36
VIASTIDTLVYFLKSSIMILKCKHATIPNEGRKSQIIHSSTCTSLRVCRGFSGRYLSHPPHSASFSTPMLSHFPKAPLTPSGLIELDRENGEVELMVVTDVALRDATHSRESHVISIATLTNHRLVFRTDRHNDEAFFLHLGRVVKTEASAVTLLSLSSSPHVILDSDTLGSYALIFRYKRDRDMWMGAIDKAIKRRGWEDNGKQGVKGASIIKSTGRSVGVDAIMTSNRLQHEHAQRLASDAFQVGTSRTSKGPLSKHEKQLLVDKLFTEATELVSIIHKYTATIEHHNQKIQSSQESTNGSEPEHVYEEPLNQLVEMLHEMGMTTALSKTSNAVDDSLYYSTLARQLADFLRYKDRLQRAGGMLSLTDIYCFFNRARGVHTISPQDLLLACRKCQSLQLGMSLRVFPSGVMVLQDDTLMNDKVVIQTIYNLCWTKQLFTIDGNERSPSLARSLSSMDVCRIFHVSPLLAQELLLIVEKAGFICRDYTTEQGTVFYPNCFVNSTTCNCITYKVLNNS